jgi:hypothetical protein
MLAYAAVELAKRRDLQRDPESNVLLEAFAIHTRCLRDFLFGERGRHAMDAFAADFCAPGAWKAIRGEVPPALKEVDDRNRLGREVVHLTYERAAVPAEIKDWPVSDIVREIVEALDAFAVEALPERLDDETRQALSDLESPPPSGVGPISVATGIHVPYTGGTIDFPDFQIGS